MRLQFSRGKFIDEKGNELTRSAENPSGNMVLMSMTKNKTCPPTRRTGFYTLDYANGINYLMDFVDVAIKYGAIEKSGAWFTIIDIDSGEVLSDKVQGIAKIYDLLENDLELLSKLEKMIDNKMLEE